jgi:hypothetical protein
MIIYDLYIQRACCKRRPFETYPPLLVDTDRVLPRSISLQGFKTIAREAREIGEGGGCLEYFEALPALPIESLERPHEFASGEKLGAPVPEAQDHAAMNIVVWTMYVKRKYST